jgi:hypothetical protein
VITLAAAKTGSELLIRGRGYFFVRSFLSSFNKISYCHIFPFIVENTRPGGERLCNFERRAAVNDVDKLAVFGQTKLTEHRHALPSH